MSPSMHLRSVIGQDDDVAGRLCLRPLLVSPVEDWTQETPDDGGDFLVVIHCRLLSPATTGPHGMNNATSPFACEGQRESSRGVKISPLRKPSMCQPWTRCTPQRQHTFPGCGQPVKARDAPPPASALL